MNGFSVPYRYDGNRKGGGLLMYICKDMQSKLLISKSKCNIETLSVAFNLRQRKLFLIAQITLIKTQSQIILNA